MYDVGWCKLRWYEVEDNPAILPDLQSLGESITEKLPYTRSRRKDSGVRKELGRGKPAVESELLKVSSALWQQGSCGGSPARTSRDP